MLKHTYIKFVYPIILSGSAADARWLAHLQTFASGPFNRLFTTESDDLREPYDFPMFGKTSTLLARPCQGTGKNKYRGSYRSSSILSVNDRALVLAELGLNLSTVGATGSLKSKMFCAVEGCRDKDLGRATQQGYRGKRVSRCVVLVRFG